MLIKYTFATGETTEVEVDEKIGEVIIDSRKSEETYDRKQRYHCYSLDAIDFEGLEYSDAQGIDDHLINHFDAKNKRKLIIKCLGLLTEKELRRLIMFSNGCSYREIARREGVSSHSKIRKSVKSACKKILNYLQNGGPF